MFNNYEQEPDDIGYDNDSLTINCPECGKVIEIYGEAIQNYFAGIEIWCDDCAGLKY